MKRPGYSLIEMVVALGSASVLVVGLSSTLYVSARSLDVDRGASLSRASGDTAAAQIMADVRTALEITELQPQAVTVSVPDRDADGQPEIIRYAWSGVSGDPLLRTLNGGTPVAVQPDVTSLDFVWLARPVTAQDVTIEPPPPWPVVEGVSLQVEKDKRDELDIDTPTGTQAGELLIAAVVVKKNRESSLNSPSGWSPLTVKEEAGKVTLGVWWRLATPSEPAIHRFTWSGTERSLGWIVRISNQWPGSPITTFATNQGKDDKPRCPAVSTTVDHSLILRMGGFDKDEVKDDTGLNGHTDLVSESAGEHVSGGAGYFVLNDAGTATPATFELGKDEEYRTISIVVAPQTN